ncbi:hypothetical protein T08_14811, partial [Trichinella sp. T8]
MASWRSLKKLQWNIRKEEDIVPFAAKPLEEEEVEVQKSIGCKERKEEADTYAVGVIKKAMLQGKYLTSGYALSYASGKFFKKIPAGYAPGNASGKIFALRLCSGQRLRQNFHNREKFRDFQKYSRRLRPRLRFRQFLKKYLPSGYATGYF